MTGFSDGEASFSLRTTIDETRKIKVRVIPIFSIELHIRDIEVLNYILSYFKVGSVKPRLRGDRETAIYAVNSIKELTTVIIPHFKQYPLITQKHADFILFADAIELINSKHLTEQGILKILSIKDSMGKGLSPDMKILYPNLVKLTRLVIDKQTIKSIWWLIGFVDAEGCFYIKVAKSKQVSLSFSLSQHSRDTYLFTVIRDYINCGILESVKTRNDIRLQVYSIKDLVEKIIPLFQDTLITQKKEDFERFKEVSILMFKEHLLEQGLNKIILIKNKKFL